MILSYCLEFRCRSLLPLTPWPISFDIVERGGERDSLSSESRGLVTFTAVTTITTARPTNEQTRLLLVLSYRSVESSSKIPILRLMIGTILSVSSGDVLNRRLRLATDLFKHLVIVYYLHNRREQKRWNTWNFYRDIVWTKKKNRSINQRKTTIQMLIEPKEIAGCHCHWSGNSGGGLCKSSIFLSFLFFIFLSPPLFVLLADIQKVKRENFLLRLYTKWLPSWNSPKVYAQDPERVEREFMAA